jgi:hypothetical protein
MTNPVFQKPSVSPEKHDREAFEPDTGQRSRAIIPGDDPGDQQLPERGFYSTLVRSQPRDGGNRSALGSSIGPTNSTR